MDNNPVSWKQFGRRLTNRAIRRATYNEVKFVMFCFAFLQHRGSRSVFWDWISRERHTSQQERRSILNYMNPETEYCDSLGFLDLIDSHQFMNIMRDVIGRMINSNGGNIGQIINGSFSWSEQPEGHEFWSGLNSYMDHAYCAIRRVRRLDDENALSISIEEMRDLISQILRHAGLHSHFNQFFDDYPRLVREREEQYVRAASIRFNFSHTDGDILSDTALDQLWREITNSSERVNLQSTTYLNTSTIRADPASSSNFVYVNSPEVTIQGTSSGH